MGGRPVEICPPEDMSDDIAAAMFDAMRTWEADSMDLSKNVAVSVGLALEDEETDDARRLTAVLALLFDDEEN